MSNSAFLLAGSERQLDAWWDAGEESGAVVLSQCGRGTPVLWPAMFESSEISLHAPDPESDAPTRYRLRTDPLAGAERLITRHAAVAGLLSVPADLSDWAGLIADALRRIKARWIELDVTEQVLLIGPERYFPELLSFLRYVANPRRYAGGLASLLPRRKRTFRQAHNFVAYACNLLDVPRIPTIAEYQQDPTEYGGVTADLVGCYEDFAKSHQG